MPVCRHCGSRISKLDKDRCPVCGELNPLEGVNSDTVEVTGVINISSSDDFSDFKPKTKKAFLLLSCLIGWLGVHFFYLKYKRAGFIWLAINLVILASGFCAFFFGVHSLLLAILVPALIVYAANISFGLVMFKKPSFKDGDGNLLR